MLTTSRPLSGLSLASLAVALLSPGVARAGAQAPASLQTDTQDSSSNGEIVVTSRHKAENAQDVPFSVNTLTRKDIETQNIRRTEDYFNRTPGVSLIQSMSAGSNSVSIRGISQARLEETPIAVWIDGLPNIDSRQLTNELGNVESIEVLKGPQGALYGPNAVAGAINITTEAAPDRQLGSLELGGGNGSTYSANARYGNRLNQDGTLKFIFDAGYRRFGGLIENETLGKPIDNRTSIDAHLKVRYEAKSDLTFDLIAGASHDSGGGDAWIYQPLDGVNSARAADLPIISNNKGHNLRDIQQLGLITRKTTDWGEIKNTVSWSHIREYYTGDSWPYSQRISSDPLPGYDGEGSTSSYDNLNGATEELRLSSSRSSSLNWTTGVYAQYVNRFESFATNYDEGKGILPVFRAPRGTDSINPTLQMAAYDYRNLNLAWFGQLSYRIESNLEITGGLRYEYDTRKQRNETPDAFNTVPDIARSAHFEEPEPQFNISWKPGRNYTLYANFSRAFLSGGWNPAGVSQLANSANLSTIKDIYPKERSTTYELGFKTQPTTWLTFNGAGYFTQLDNQPYYAYVPQINTSLIVPIDSVHIFGYEFEARAALTHSFSLRGSIGYAESTIHKYSIDPAYEGNAAPYTPNYTANVGWTFEHPLSERLKTVVNFDYRLQGRQYFDPGETTSRQVLHLIEATLSVGSADGKWTATLWGKNLLNQTYLAEYVLGGYAYRAEPRTFGGSLKFNFF